METQGHANIPSLEEVRSQTTQSLLQGSMETQGHAMLAAQAQACFDHFNSHMPKQPNLGLHIKRATPFITSTLSEKLRALHSAASGARHSMGPVGEGKFNGIDQELLAELRSSSQHIGARLKTLEGKLAHVLERLDVIENGIGRQQDDEPDGFSSWFAQDGQTGSTTTVNAESPFKRGHEPGFKEEPCVSGQTGSITPENAESLVVVGNSQTGSMTPEHAESLLNPEGGQEPLFKEKIGVFGREGSITQKG